LRIATNSNLRLESAADDGIVLHDRT